MALIIPPGYLQAVYEFQMTGDPESMVVTCGHEIDSASGANAADAADDLFLSFNAEIFQSLGHNVYSFVGVTAYIGQDGPTLVVPSTQAATTGPATSVSLPQNSSWLIRKRTDLGGRRGRGRMYLPGIAESNVDHAGNINAGNVTFAQAAFDGWYDFLTGGVGARLYPPVVLHRSEGAGVEPAPTPVTMFTVESKIATQRRRLRP